MKEKWSNDKLNGSKWNTFKFQMKHLLLAKGLWGLVDGSEVLADDAMTAVQALFRLRLQKAFLTIVLAIDSAQLYLITSSEEPKQAWDALRKHFEQETLANKLILKMQYFRSESDEQRPKNSDFEGEDVYAAAFIHRYIHTYIIYLFTQVGFKAA